MSMKNTGTVRRTNTAVMQALAAAFLYGMNSPFAKILLGKIPPMYLTAFLYLGVALGMAVICLVSRGGGTEKKESGVSRKDIRWVILMILLDIAAPYLLLCGLRLTAASNASMLFNFEMVATSVIALAFFREAIGKRMWLSIGIITAASLILSIDFKSLTAFSFSAGSLLVLGACLCWGLENNCTRSLSAKNPAHIVIIKGFGSGTIALLLACGTENMASFQFQPVFFALVLGFVTYGLSIFFYVKAQRGLGAARTSLYYAASPFIGVVISYFLLAERPGLTYGIGAVLMVAGVMLAVLEKHSHIHVHLQMVHEHCHNHIDEHHAHAHDVDCNPETEHTHAHLHDPMEHGHEHRPDIHHRHAHGVLPD